MFLLVVLHLVILACNNFVADTCDRIAGKGCIPVYDIIISNIGIPLVDHYYLPDLFIVISIILLLPFLTYNMYVQFIKEHMVLLLIRSASLLSTIGYISARYHKQKIKLGYMNGGHADLTISGHAMTITLFLYFILDNTINNNYIIYSVVAIVLLSFGILSNILNGDHYTSDVILAVVLAYLVHY